MKYANFCDAGRSNINIGDYLQFIVVDYLYGLMGIPEDEIIRLGFRDISKYDGEEVVFPFCYSIIDFAREGVIDISDKIKPVFFSVTLSTIDKFHDLDEFLGNSRNRSYLTRHSPVGCRDEITYDILTKHGIPAYINGCMTAIFPKYGGVPGGKVLFADTPQALLPHIPGHLMEDCEFSTQQYHFAESEIKDYRKIFAFVHSKYRHYMENTKLAVTSRLHVALPLTAFGIPVILAKDKVDGRFSFIEAYLPIYDRDSYHKIDWSPNVPDIEEVKELLTRHAIGRIMGDGNEAGLKEMESRLTAMFKSRKALVDYKDSHAITHKNGDRFDEYAAKHWKADEDLEYALWGASENNAGYWKSHIEAGYPKAKLSAVFDSFRGGELFGLPYRHPREIEDCPNLAIIVCSVGAANSAATLFKRLGIGEGRYCITADCFISQDDMKEKARSVK